MAREIEKLTAQSIKRLKTVPGRHSDGSNLYLSVSTDGKHARWTFMYRWAGRTVEMGLGPEHDVTLAEARRAAKDARALIRQGVSPLEAKRSGRGSKTFIEASEDLIEALSKGWRNPKHQAQWRMTLLGKDVDGNSTENNYCASIHKVPVAEITTNHIVRVLEPIWTTKPETANRLRGRIERVLDRAKAKGHRSGDNPASKTLLKNLLAEQDESLRGHHAALPYADAPAFMATLRTNVTMSNLCLEFAILTAARSGEARGALWKEIDRTAQVWAVPAWRMKERRLHNVPLTDRCIEILSLAAAIAGKRQSEYIFPGQARGKPLSDGSLKKALKTLGHGDVTPHGFRSTFRDWAGDQTDHARETAEAALAHIVGDKAEQAYRRGDVLEKRRKLMDDWANYLASTPN